MQSQEAPQSKLLTATMEEMKELEPRAVMPQADVAQVGSETAASKSTLSHQRRQDLLCGTFCERRSQRIWQC